MSGGVRAGLCLLALPALLLAGSARAVPPSVRLMGVSLHADSLVMARQVPAAERYLDSLVTVARARGDRELEMVAVLRRGSSWLYTRGAATATAEVERGIVLARALRDTGAWCRGLMVVQYAAFDAGQIKAGEAAARKIITLARPRADRESEAVGSIGLGYAALQNRAYARAVTQYRRAIVSAQAAGIVRHELRARVGLARAQFGLARLDEARSELRTVVALAQQTKDVQSEADAWNNLGAYEQQRGDPTLAPRYYERSLVVRRRAGLRTSGIVSNLALTQLQLGRFADAATTLLADLPSLLRTGTPSERLLHARTLGEVRISQRRYAEADSLLSWAWRSADSLGSAQEAVPAADSYFRLLLVGGTPAPILNFGTRLLERYESRMNMNERVTVVVGLARARLVQGRPDAALQLLRPYQAAADTAKTLTPPTRADLQLAIANAYQPTDPAKALTWLGRGVQTWENARGSLRSPLHREAQALPSEFATTTAELWLTQVRTGTAQQRTIRAFEAMQRFKGRTLLERGAAVRGLERSAGSWSFSLAALQRSGLRPEEVFLDYQIGRASGYVFVVTTRSIGVHAVPGDDSLRLLVSRFRDLQRDPRSSASLREAAGRELSRRLLGPASREIASASRVLVSPMATLGSVPFAVLTGPAGAPLGQTHELVNVPSAAWLIDERRRPGPSTARLAVVGRTTDDHARTLEGVAGETRWLERQFERVVSRVHPGDRTLADVLEVMRQGQVLHVASHATANAENPWDSAMLLGRGDDESAWLTAERIALERLPARLCVIAGCNSDVRSPMMTENANGLSSAFLAAGASTVVATLWAVDDRVTEKWTQAFYSELGRGHTVGEAARSAQAALRADPATAHPAYWAAFVTVGDPTLRPRLVPRPSLLPGVLR